MRATAKRLTIAVAVLAATVVAGCGGGGDTSTNNSSDFVISSAAPPIGDPDLDRGKGDTHIEDRVAVTPDGKPTAVYAIKLKDLKPGTWVGARGALTVTKCAHTDYDPTKRQTTGCQHTSHYDFNPVKVTSQLKLVPDQNGKPDPSAAGVPISEPDSFDCTTAEHHCVPVAIGETVLTSDQVSSPGEDMWLIYSLEASSPKAANCEANTSPKRCDVLAVESQKHTAMYGGVNPDGRPAGTTLPRDTHIDSKQLPTVDEDEPRFNDRRVIYSVELAPKEQINNLLGDQLIAIANFTVNESEQLAPLVSGYLVLANSPRAQTGRFLSSDTYDKNRTGDTGENCTGKCTYIKPAAATTITKCDVDAGRRYVNLVADSVRTAAKPGESVPVVDDGFLEVLQYPGETDIERKDCKGGKN